jgi:glycosyltransferase involved in cell wall biosynthesis
MFRIVAGAVVKEVAAVPASRRIVCLCANTTWYIVNFRSRLIETLQADGWQVMAYSPPDRHVDRLRALGVEHVPMRLDNCSTNPARELSTLIAVRRSLAAIRPDVVLTWTPKVNIYVSLAARTLRIPAIANISGLGRAFVTGGWLERLTRLLYRHALSWPEKVFFQNEEDRERFVQAALVDRSRTQRLPGSGVDVDRFAPRPRSRDAAFRFLLVARLLWDKGIGEFVAAAMIVRAAHPEVEFALVGFVDADNPASVPRTAIEQWERDGTVRYLGSFDDMVPVYAEADCVVLPSYYAEGVPRSLLEAASMGKLVITTDAAGCRDTVVDGATGLLVLPRDVDDLAAKMLHIFRMDEGIRSAMADAARMYATDNFDERLVLDAYRTALAGLLPRHNAGRNGTAIAADSVDVAPARKIS